MRSAELRRSAELLKPLGRLLFDMDEKSLWERETATLPRQMARRRRAYRDFVARELTPLAAGADATPTGYDPRPLLATAARAGLQSEDLPPPWGTMVLGAIRYPLFPEVLKAEELAAVCAGLGLSLLAHRLGTAPLLLCGDLGAMRRWLVPICRDNRAGSPRLAAFAITEPAVGSDVEDTDGARTARFQTSAKRVQGGYLLNGQKVFITGGAHADLVTVFATLEPDGGRSGRVDRDWTCFVVEKGARGFRTGRSEHKLRASARQMPPSCSSTTSSCRPTTGSGRTLRLGHQQERAQLYRGCRWLPSPWGSQVVPRRLPPLTAASSPRRETAPRLPGGSAHAGGPVARDHGHACHGLAGGPPRAAEPGDLEPRSRSTAATGPWRYPPGRSSCWPTKVPRGERGGEQLRDGRLNQIYRGHRPDQPSGHGGGGRAAGRLPRPGGRGGGEGGGGGGGAPLPGPGGGGGGGGAAAHRGGRRLRVCVCVCVACMMCCDGLWNVPVGMCMCSRARPWCRGGSPCPLDAIGADVVVDDFLGYIGTQSHALQGIDWPVRLAFPTPWTFPAATSQSPCRIAWSGSISCPQICTTSSGPSFIGTTSPVDARDGFGDDLGSTGPHLGIERHDLGTAAQFLMENIGKSDVPIDLVAVEAQEVVRSR